MWNLNLKNWIGNNRHKKGKLRVRSPFGAHVTWPRNGDQDMENTMNHLQIIKDRIQKNQRLTEAQRLAAKAYRGVEYIDAIHDRPKKSRPLDLAYRGIHYEV